MCSAKRHVRFPTESRHVRRNEGCPLWAISGYRHAYSVRPKQQERSPILICVKRILKSPCLAIGLGTTWLGGANVRFLSSNKILRGDYAGGGDYADRHSVAVRCSDRRSTFSYR